MEAIMRKVLAGTFVSVDGVMQAPGGPEEDTSGGFKFGGWVAPLWDEAAEGAVGELFNGPYDLLLGRKTYDIFAAYWPNYKDGPDEKIARGFDAATKYVATSSPTPLTWEKSVALHHPLTDVARLKKEDGPPLVIQGSSLLIQTLLTRQLIDRLTLITFPVLLGDGKRLFGDEAHGALKLVKSHTSKAGVTVSTYEPAGAVRTGSMDA
jgi:dihydrofolate reductase